VGRATCGWKIISPILISLFCEDAMNWNHWIRQIHRWVTVAITVTVIANLVAIAGAGGTSPSWITYSPLLPLALLLFSGLYLFVLPYLARRRNRVRTE
jgi:hypothetical protein